MEKPTQIASSTLTSDLRIIGRGYQAHSPGRACEHVAERVGKFLDFVRLELNLIVDDMVVDWPNGALQPTVCCHWFQQLDSQS